MISHKVSSNLAVSKRLMIQNGNDQVLDTELDSIVIRRSKGAMWAFV